MRYLDDGIWIRKVGWEMEAPSSESATAGGESLETVLLITSELSGIFMLDWLLSDLAVTKANIPAKTTKAVNFRIEVRFSMTKIRQVINFQRIVLLFPENQLDGYSNKAKMLTHTVLQITLVGLFDILGMVTEESECR